MSENLNQWFSIELGGEFRLSVTGKTATDNNFIVAVRIIPTAGTEIIVPDNEVNPGPKIKSFSEDTSYVVRVAVKFLSAANQTAVIECVATDASGNAIPDWWGNTQYIHEVVGKTGDVPGRSTLLFVQD